MNKRQRKKAVAVARDVIEQLRIKRLQASPGTYCSIAYDNGFFEDHHEDQDSFQEAFAKDEKIVCHVCAIGAMYIGYINRFNNVTNEEASGANDWDMVDILSNIFNEDQLRLMECVFENGWVDQEPDWYMNMSYQEQENFTQRCWAYHMRYRGNPDGLLRVIMLNVIRNDGEFVLPKRVKQPSLIK